MTAEVIALRSDDAACRAAAMARHPAGKAVGTCPRHAADLHRIASLITTGDLPPAHLSISGRDVLVDLTTSELVENGVRRWAAALGFEIVTEVRTDTGRLWSSSGFRGGQWFHITGALPEPS